MSAQCQEDVMSQQTGNDVSHFDPSNSVSNLATTTYVNVGPATVAYRRFGKRSDAPLVCLHRFRGNMDQWDPYFLDLIAEKRELIILDNTGVGLSTGQVPDSVAGMAENVALFLDKLGLDRVDVLGWSLGGCVAQSLTLQRPNQVRRLILAATSPGGIADAPKMADKTVQ